MSCSSSFFFRSPCTNRDFFDLWNAVNFSSRRNKYLVSDIRRIWLRTYSSLYNLYIFFAFKIDSEYTILYPHDNCEKIFSGKNRCASIHSDIIRICPHKLYYRLADLSLQESSNLLLMCRWLSHLFTSFLVLRLFAADYPRRNVVKL